MNVTLKRLLIFFSVSLNLGFILYAGYSYISHHDHGHGRHDVIGRNILDHMSADISTKEKAEQAIADFDTSLSELNKKILQSKLALLKLYTGPEAMLTERIEEQRKIHMELLNRRSEMIHKHFLNMKNILGSPASETYFNGLYEHLSRHLKKQ